MSQLSNIAPDKTAIMKCVIKRLLCVLVEKPSHLESADSKNTTDL